MASGRQHRLLDTGTIAPLFRLNHLDGGAVSLSEILARGPALFAFFKITCPVCQLCLPYLGRIHKTGSLAIYGISQNNPQDTREFNEDFGITFPVLLDTESSGYPVSNNFGISSVPTLFLIEPDGRISRVIEGWQKKQMEWLAESRNVALFRPEDRVPEWKSG